VRLGASVAGDRCSARIGKGTCVLDVGCGSGEFCRLAYAIGAHVSGIDAAEAMIELARVAVPQLLAV